MSDLEQQLPEIKRLRADRDRLGQRVYALRTEIARTSAAVRRSRVSESRRRSPDSEVIAAARAAIAELEARLRELGVEERRARAAIARVEEAERHQEFLERSLAGLRAAASELGARLRQETDSKPVGWTKVAGIRAAITSTEAQAADVERSLEESRRGDRQRERDADAARGDLRRIATERARARASIDAKEEEIGALRDTAEPSTDRLEERLAALNTQFTGVKAEWKGARDGLHDRIIEIYVDPHPRDAVAQMGDATPFVLLPVRIETRFIVRQLAAGPTGQLLLRIYPDDIAIHTHENELTEREVKEGERYWRVIFDIEKGAASNTATSKTEAWKSFAVLFGPSRSAWVARQTRPTNWADLSTITSADALVFPAHDLTRIAAWTRAPRTQVLPDRFVVLLYRGETVKQIVGNPILDDLQVGPEPLDLVAEADQADVEDSFVTVDGQLTFGANFDWASNFDRAVELGMGFRIPLDAGAATNGFDKIVVLGVMASAGPDAGRGMLETLLANHHHSPKGLTLLRQGTATNNMDGQGSGYSINDALDQTKEVTGLDTPLFTETSNTDGRALADALGISYETLQYVFNSDNTDQRDAVAMNRALYPATLGYYFDTLLAVMPAVARDRLREFFVRNVTGRGPLSAIRVGDQPYGMLLTSDFANWSELGSVTRKDRFPAVLYEVLKRFDATWQTILPRLVFAGKPGLSIEKALLDVLGLQATSATFAQRVAYDIEYLVTLADFTLGGREFRDIWFGLLDEAEVTDWLRTLGYDPSTVPAEDRPQLLRLIYQHYTTGIDAANLIDAVPLSETATIREYETATHKNYLHWLRDATSLAVLSAQNFGGAPVPTALLYLKLRHALLLELHKTTVAWLEHRGYDASMTMAPRTFHNLRPQGDLSRWELMSAPVSAVGASAAAGRLAIADYIMSPSVVIDEAANLEQMRQALDTMANLSTARLERCFTEHIDACTYRLDAWQTALFKTRLEAMRGSGQSRGLGVYLGAYGWVENVRPSASAIAATNVPDKLKSAQGAPMREYAANGGFIHAPSINHASAAALLRSGYMSHATPESPDTMSVNLSSERVRRALFILQGMRNGQSIEALLGYQFERGIHDRASADATLAVLNGFIVDIRIKFPIKRVRLGAGESGGAEETVDAYDVVNGVTLVETPNPDWASITGAPPATLTAARIAALNAERDKTADTLDAIKDLLLSESALQLVLGNFDRAGAVLGSMKDAQAPPDLDVIKTPRSSHFTFTQRVALHFPRLDPLDPAAAAWPAIAMTPRALLEPGVNRWLADVLGAPENIVFTAFEVQASVNAAGEPIDVLVNPSVMSVADLGLQPIDLVYILGADIATGAGGRSGASELESRIAWRYRADNGLDETPRVTIQFGAPKNQAGTVTMAESMPLMRALQSVLSDSRALDARDYHTATTRGAGSTGPAATPSPGVDFDDVRSRAESLQSQLADVVSDMLPLPFSARIDGAVVASLEELFDVLPRAEEKLADVTFTFAASDMLTLQQLLTRMAAFGIADAFPRFQDVTRNDAKLGLLLQAMDAVSGARARMDASAKLLSDAVAAAAAGKDRAVSLTMNACKAILGSAFTVIPGFALPNEADVLLAQSDNAQLMDHAVNMLGMQSPEDEWIHSVAHVRPKVAAWERIRLLHETLLGTTLDLTAIQLPYRGRDSWVAVTLPDTDPATGEPFDIAHDTLSMVVHGTAAFAVGSLRSGVMIDSWTETIPAREQSTGIAFHYNRPDSMPPQAILLAVPPVVTGHWSWEALVNIVSDTLRRAKLRAVEPHLLDEYVQKPEVGVLLPAIISEFQQYDLNLSLDLRLNLVGLAAVLGEMYMNPNLNV